MDSSQVPAGHSVESVLRIYDPACQILRQRIWSASQIRLSQFVQGALIATCCERHFRTQYTEMAWLHRDTQTTTGARPDEAETLEQCVSSSCRGRMCFAA